ncbi:radical SAM/SPASM domain-containing protein [Hanstruepera marina]|uniref:radical SAM/SPASM domain-containing protein n=1 Tax=Hanstruepera marina TaxID=2873265 RepID=UPI001CA73775|nr:radical SAM protein [Hanstruepera marina]
MLVELQKELVEDEVEKKAAAFDNYNQYIISGLSLKFIHLKLKLSLLKIAIICYNNPLDWVKSLFYLVKLRRRFLGDNFLKKMIYSNGRYYMGLYTPGWNSNVYKQFIASQLNDFKTVKIKANRFNTVFLAITKKCALQCDHCYEWDNLNKKDVLTSKKLRLIIKKLQLKGVSQIQLLGGEPLLKMDLLTESIKGAHNKTDFWVTTSGFKLTNDNAYRLKEAGLTGVIVSLDHYMPEKHNFFRKFDDAYYWVEEGLKNAANNNLVTALSICVTKEFISEDNLMKYMNLAKKLNVAFVQFLEPKSIGHYAEKDVALSQSHIKILEGFFLKMNFSSAHNKYPIITYHGYYQRRQGCFSAGVKGLYVDTDGDINACPFCHKKTGNVLDETFDKNLNVLKEEGCPTYSSKTC